MPVSVCWSRRALARFGLVAALFSLLTACGSADDASPEVPSFELASGPATERWTGPRASAPLVSSVAPKALAEDGGTPFDVHGTNLVSGATVSIGGTPCPDLVWIDSTHVTCVTPPKAPGIYDVVVVNPDGRTSGTSGAALYESVSGPQPVAAEPPSLRGTNLVGMEGGFGFDQATGPVPNTHYAVHSTQVIDYLASKKMNVIRLLFSWERMQSRLLGPIPAAATGNYRSYFDDFERIVAYATNVKGMTVIIEPWQASASGGVGGPSWRGNVVGNGVVTNAHFADFWGKLAKLHAGNARVAIGLVNEPNGMSTMTWFGAAQAAITAIRDAGFKGDIHVPGNGWSGAGSWTDDAYDAAATKRSNAYGWLNARGPGQALLDPLGKLLVAVHTYADADAAGSTTNVVSSTVSRTRVKVVVDWARAHGLGVFVGEIGMYASAPNAAANWKDFVAYAKESRDTLRGFAWWGCGKPGWWDDVAAAGGGHFSITPTGGYAGDTPNMTMIAGAFTP
jgi:endoglucanase